MSLSVYSFPEELLLKLIPNIPAEGDLQRFGATCKQLNKIVTGLNDKRDDLCEKWSIFGVSEWRKYNVRIGNVPRLYDVIVERMENSNPPPICILKPGRINGKIFDNKKLVEIFKASYRLNLSLSGLEYCKGNLLPYWSLISPNVASNAGSYAKDEAFVQELSEKTQKSFSIPNSFDMSLCLVINQIKYKIFMPLPQSVTCSNMEKKRKKKRHVYISSLVPKQICYLYPRDTDKVFHSQLNLKIKTHKASDTSYGVRIQEKFG